MLASNFGPRPLTARSRCARAACSSASGESMPSSEKSSRARLGPSPGRRVSAISPAGNFARSLTAAGMSPLSASAWIFSCSVLPTPASSVARPSAARAATETVASRIALAAER
jgi:hypothetical protein